MIEGSAAYGKYYPRVSYKQTLNIHEMAKHMSEHNTPFSEGTIEGILRDFVKCTREQTLMGNTVKVDDLAIFKVSVIGNGCAKLYDPETDKTISASIGTIGKNDKTGAAVQSLKLLAQATGEYTREELNKVAKLGWTDKAAAEIAAAKAEAIGGGANSGGNSQGGNSQGGNDSGDGPRLLSSHIIFMLYFYYFHSLNGGVWQQVVTSPFLNVVNSRFAKKLPDIEVSAVLDCTDSERQWN